MNRVNAHIARGERGAALVEIIVAIIILAGVLLSLAAASGHAARQMYYSKREMNVWGALQSQAESLRAAGYTNVKDGSASVEGYAVKWTVAGTDPKTVTVVLSYKTRDGTAATKSVELYYPASDTL
jgi:Tfp pilus assembly protein PilV